MARRVSWTNNSSGHLGTRIYRAPTLDPQNLPAPVATVDPVAQGATAEWIDTEGLAAGDYEYAVRDYDGSGEGALSGVVTYAAPEDYSSAQVGDYIGGGVYAGVDSIDGVDFHIIAGKAEAEGGKRQWKTSSTTTPGTTSASDGLANTLAMESAGLSEHPAGAYCLAYSGGGYSDWHLPARTQLTLIYNNLSSHPEFADNVATLEFTYSSTEASANSAWHRKISTGEEDDFRGKQSSLLVRPIRRVAV